MNLQAAENMAAELMGKFGLFGKDMVLYQPNTDVEAIRARHAHEGRLYPFSTHWHFAFDTARRQFGCCHYGSKKITLSRALVEINNEQQVRDTILHEIAHALCPTKAHHGPIWKAMARAVGAKPERCYTTKDVATLTYKWRWICAGCGDEETVIQERKPGFDGEKMCIACYNAAKAVNPQEAGYRWRRFHHKWQRLEQIVKQPHGEACAPRPIMSFTMPLPPLPLDMPVKVSLPLSTPAPVMLPPRPYTPVQAKEIETSRVIALYQRGLKIVDIAVECGYQRGHGQNRVRAILIKAGTYKEKQ